MAVRLAGNGGPRKIWGGRDADGHRTYHAIFRVQGDYGDGPANVLQCPGLPIEGTLWIIGDDIDVYAWCRTENTVNPVGEWREGYGWPRFWDIQCTFSTRPPGRDRGGRQQPEGQRPRKEDPLTEYDKLSGGFIKYSEELSVDRFGVPIMSTSWEPIRGPQVEFDRNRPQIRVEQNVLDLQLDMLSEMVDTLNDAPIWGYPKRCVKLSVPSWQRLYHGSGIKYYTRVLEFDVNVKIDPITGEATSGFDREVYDEGSKALNGSWDQDSTSETYGQWKLENIGGATPDPGNPAHYSRYKDRNGDVTRCFFDNSGSGKPIDEKLGGTITAITIGGSDLFDSTDHGLFVGDVIYIRGMEGADADEYNNAKLTVSATPTANTFEVVDANNAPVNGILAAGDPEPRWIKITSNINKILVQGYDESNFLLLGVPLEI